MESNFVQLTALLEELKMKREQVTRLNSEVSQLSRLLIERESELYIKSAQCQQLESKMTKGSHEVKQLVEEFNSRIKSIQAENNHMEMAIMGHTEKLQRVQTEKQCLGLKVSYFEREIKEINDHVRTLADSLPKVSNQQDALIGTLKVFDEKQIKIVEMCEIIQRHAGRVLREAEEKWSLAQSMSADRPEMENAICSARARIRMLEMGMKCSNAAGAIPARQQNEALSKQLEMVRQREEELRRELVRERQDKMDLQGKYEQVLDRLAHHLSSDQKIDQVGESSLNRTPSDDVTCA